MAPTAQSEAYNPEQLFNEAYDRVNDTLGGLYTTSFHRLALQRYILRHVFDEREDIALLLGVVDYEIIHPTAKDLAQGFLRKYVGEFGWGKEPSGRSDRRPPLSPDLQADEDKLKRELEAMIQQLLQMPAERERWRDFYSSVLCQNASKQDEGSDVQSDPEITTTRDRLWSKPVNPRSLRSRVDGWDRFSLDLRTRGKGSR